MANLNVNKHENLLKNCVKELHGCLEYVSKYSNKAEEHTNVLKEIAKNYCVIDAEHSKVLSAQSDTNEHFKQHEDSTDDVHEVFKKYLSEQQVNSYENHPIWKKINEDTNSVEDQSEECEDDSMFEEGIVPSQFEPPIDPITKKPIEHPCRNQKCHHVYEYNTIMDHLNNIKSSKGKPRCPYIGCTNKNMNNKYIIKDAELEQQILTYNMTQPEQSNENFSVTEIL